MNDKFLQFLGISKKAGMLVEGYNTCEELIKKKKLYLMVVSDDVSQNTKEKFTNYCKSANIALLEGYSKEELGKILGRDEINLLGIKDLTMARKLKDLWWKV
jgi:ribosomal protein L7Ae-like RNA K-turn-binding protein